MINLAPAFSRFSLEDDDLEENTVVANNQILIEATTEVEFLDNFNASTDCSHNMIPQSTGGLGALPVHPRMNATSLEWLQARRATHAYGGCSRHVNVVQCAKVLAHWFTLIKLHSLVG